MSRSSAVSFGGRPPVRPARFAAANPARVRSRTRGALEFGQRAEHVKDQDALRRRRVDRLCEASKADVAQAQLLDRLDELLDGSRQPVELPDDQRVAAASVVERFA